jgi:hypothetical protein
MQAYMITPKRLLALTLKWLGISVLVLFCTIWVTDELSFQYKVHVSKSASAFGAVDMQHMLAIGLKNGKVEYAMDRTRPTQTLPCVYSLFPHAGLKPCWYLTRQSEKAVPLVIFSIWPAYFDLRTLSTLRFDTLKRPALF